jgi:hypothetical protein
MNKIIKSNQIKLSIANKELIYQNEEIKKEQQS